MTTRNIAGTAVALLALAGCAGRHEHVPDGVSQQAPAVDGYHVTGEPIMGIRGQIQAEAQPGAELTAERPASGATSGGHAIIPDIRSLRRGGGARGGVEGDPVSLNNPDSRYADYLLRVKRQIEEKMAYPCVTASPTQSGGGTSIPSSAFTRSPTGDWVAHFPTTRSCDYKSAELVLEFGIRKDGELAYVDLLRPAAYPAFNDASADAIRRAAPFPPLPDTIQQLHPTGLPISAHFRYKYDPR